MLKLLRNKGTQKKIYMGLAVVVVFSFVISGILIGEDDKKTLSSLAKYEKRNISVQEYLNNYRAAQRQADMMYGDKLKDMQGRINFQNEAWDRLLLLEYTKKNNIRAADSEVVDWLAKQTGFQKNGKFDEVFYKMYVERGLRSTPREFEEEIRQMLTIGKIQDHIKRDIKLTDETLKELYKKENSEKDLLYALVSSESFDTQVEVTDTEIQKLYEVVKDKLTEPETNRRLTIDEAKEEVKKKVRAGKTSEMALKRLSDVKAKITDPAKFEDVLKAEGITVEKLEKYKKGMYPAGIWPSENLQNAVEKLAVGDVSDVFDVPKGAMLVKVTAAHDFDEKKFEEEKKDFKEKMEAQKSREQMEKIMDEMRGKLALNVDLMKELFPADTPAPETAPAK